MQNATGKNSKTVREFLEKHYTDEIAADDAATIKLTVQALMEVASVDDTGKNIEVAVIRPGQPLEMLGDEQLDAVVKEIEAEAAEAEAKAGGGGGAK